MQKGDIDQSTPIETRISAGYPRYPSGASHGGIDITADGADSKTIYIIASADGTVSTTQTGHSNNKGSSGMASYGNLVILKHADGMSTYYAHMERVYVTEGDTVKQGQVIGEMGNTGNSYGKHLHFEVRINGDRQNPLDYVNKDEPRPTATFGNLSSEGYIMLSYFEGGRSKINDNGDYIIFNNGIDSNYELTCGLAIGSFEYGSYYKDIIPNPQIGGIVSKEDYNKIFKLKCDEVDGYIQNALAKHNITLSQNQYDAFFMFIYNMGGGKTCADEAMEAYKNGGPESYLEYTKSVSIRAVYSRRDKEYNLFVNGTYINS